MSTPHDSSESAVGRDCSAAVVELAEALAAALQAPVPDVGETLRSDLAALLPLRAQLEALVAERLAAFAARDLHQDDGFGTPTSWVTSRCNISSAEAAALLATGRRMQRFPGTAEQLRAGAISPRHARIVERAVAGLPERFTEPAVAFLTPLAAEHDPAAFAVIAQQLRETVTPELTDRETADLEASQWLDVSPFDGGLRVDGMLRGLNAEAFAAAVRRFSGPKPADDRPAKLRRADAAGEMARLASEAPVAGLAPVQVTVLCDVVTLQRAADAAGAGAAGADATGAGGAGAGGAGSGAAGAGTADTAGVAASGPEATCGRFPATVDDLVRGARGERTGAPMDWRTLVGCVTTGDTRRLVLGPDSEVLDLGRAHRFFNRTQRIAIRRGQHRCLVRGCRSSYVEYDHRTGWAEGGGTDVRNGRPFCGFHNRLRTKGWDTVDLPHGEVELVRPPGWHLRRRRQRLPRIE